MINTRFEAYKIKRELKRSGIEYEFKRQSQNEFGEPDKELTSIGIIKGLYHEENSYIQLSMGDTTQTRTKKTPLILFLYDDAATLLLKANDTVEINGKTHKVTGVTNVQEWNIILDVSLEVVDDGN